MERVKFLCWVQIGAQWILSKWYPHNTEQHAHTEAYEMYLCLCSACVNLRDLFQKQIKRVCYVQSHLYEHVHHECLYICN